VWIGDACPWRLSDIAFDVAAAKKQTRLETRLRALATAWALLGPRHRAKHVEIVWRDAQRLVLLRQERPIPPTALLDEACPDARRVAKVLDELWSPNDASASLRTSFRARARQ
jgi:hypothetical protein